MDKSGLAANFAVADMAFVRQLGLTFNTVRNENAPPELALVPGDMKVGVVANSSSFVYTVGGSRYLSKLDRSAVLFDTTARAEQVQLTRGPFGKVPTTGVFMVHKDYIVLAYVNNSNPTELQVSIIKTEGMGISYGTENAGLIVAASNAGFATLMTSNREPWLFYMPVNGVPRSKRVEGKLGESPKLKLGDDGKVEISNGDATVFSGRFVESMPSTTAPIMKKKLVNGGTSDVDAGVVPYTRDLGFQTKGVRKLSSIEMGFVAGDPNATFSNEQVGLFGQPDTTSAPIQYLFYTGVGPTVVEAPKTSADSGLVGTVYNLRFGRTGDKMETSATNGGNLVFWIGKNESDRAESYTLNGYSGNSNNGMTFGMPSGGTLRVEKGTVYFNGKPEINFYGIPLRLEVRDLIQID